MRQLPRPVDPVCPEFIRHVRGLDGMPATCRLAEYPTARAFALANPRRLAAVVSRSS